jgi:hypothetical protein
MTLLPDGGPSGLVSANGSRFRLASRSRNSIARWPKRIASAVLPV